ncbi:hypothetical protein C943_03498 [Mariniradius saccharolyticus AK6]|jgi:hypothetical protein|uniref:DUF4286 domain-containing protein n=1 Tax=Mariniradius saccharolyticus AK6 TaxID=1239962 RepID=M7XHG3_9BACT|nr:DUF4286 family protein [Mariniradius saccharolyticus]EMS34279.1 hypothetical protein C943_03498 [Mariniradius saccharolyticus AK6]
MILYNVTVNVDKDAETEWLNWMRETHIPDVLATGMFLENKLYRILHDSEDGSINYSVQYFAENMDKLNEYMQVHSKKLQQDVQIKFQDRVVSFRTLLQAVE